MQPQPSETAAPTALRSKMSPRDTCKNCNKTFATKYTRKRHEEKCCATGATGTRAITEGMAGLAIAGPSDAPRTARTASLSNSADSADARRDAALEVLMNRAAVERGHVLPLTAAVSRMATAMPSVYRKTRALPSNDPLSKNIGRLRTPLEIKNAEGSHKNITTSMALSRDGSMIATGTSNGSVIVWDTTTGVLVKQLKAGRDQPKWANGLAWSPSGRLLIGYENGIIRTWDLQSGSTKDTNVIGEEPEIQKIELSPDGTRIVIMYGGGAYIGKIGDTDRAPAKYKHISVPSAGNVPNPADDAIDVAFSPDGKTLAIADGYVGYINTNSIWDVGSSATPAAKPAAPTLISSWPGTMNNTMLASSPDTKLAWSPDGKLLVNGATYTITIYDVATGRMLGSHDVRQGDDKYTTRVISSVSWSPDGKTIAVGRAESNRIRRPEFGSVRLYEVTRENNQVRFGRSKVIGEYASNVHSVSFSADGTFLAAGFIDGTTRIWNMHGIQAGGRSKSSKSKNSRGTM